MTRRLRAGAPRALGKWGWVVLTLATILGCGGDPDPVPQVPVTLEWPAEAAAVWNRQQLTTEHEVMSWSVAESRQLLGDGLTVDLDSATIDFLELEIPPPVSFPILAWTWGEDGVGGGKGRIHGRILEPGSRIFRFELGDHLEWRGRIRTLALEPAAFEDSGPTGRRLGELRAFGRKLDPEALAGAIPRPWKVDLGFELHDGRLAPPGLGVEWRLPSGFRSVDGARAAVPRLRVGYGLEKGVREAVDFRIEGHPAGIELFTARLEPEQGGQWHWAELDIGTRAGGVAEGRRSIESLRFETNLAESPVPPVRAVGSAPPIRLERGFPVWGGVEAIAPAPPADGRPNVILLSIDTLRPDHLELYGHEHDTAPHFTAWARQNAVIFDNAIAPSPWTLPSHVSMFTGRDAIAHGVYGDRPAPDTLRMLAEILDEQGYHTAAITGGGYLNPRFGLAQGFDSYRYWAAAEGELEAGSEHLSRFLDDRPGEPFFLFFHTYEVHSPFHARRPHFEQLGGSAEVEAGSLVDLEHLPMGGNELFQMRKGLVRVMADGERKPFAMADETALRELHYRYDSGISKVDALLAPLWRRLESTGLAERTVVILTSDHGEALGERGLAGHAYLWDFNLRIPLVVALPGGRGAGTRIEQQVRTVDIVPTVLELVGLAETSGARDPSIDGVSLLPLIDAGGERLEDFPAEAWSYAASSNYGVSLRLGNRRHAIKLIYNDTAFRPALGRSELYDLGSDPDEDDELLARGEEGERFRRRVLEVLSSRGHGLELVLENPASAPLAGRLTGPSIQAMTVKSWGEGCERCFRLEGRTIEFELGAGEVGQLVILDPGSSGALELVLEAEGGNPWQRVVALDAVGEGLAFELRDGRWRAGDPDRRSVTDLPRSRFRWLGRGASGGEPGLEMDDPRLREQLEALGYVDG